MILSGHAPSYLPWLGQFEKIARSDVFVFHDTAQFERKGFMNRNRIKTPQGALWLTVPVDLRGYLERELREIEVREELGWRQLHWSSICYNYRRAPHFADYADELEALYARPWRHLSELNLELIRFGLRALEIDTRILLTSEIPGISGRKSDFVLSVCLNLGADAYYCGAQGRSYLRAEDFEAAGVEVIFQEYRHPEYPQRFGGFLPGMSFLDLLLNAGPQSRALCLGD